MADIKLRGALMKKLAVAGVARVEIERSLKSIKIIIWVTRPGVVIGRGGSGLEEVKKFNPGKASKDYHEFLIKLIEAKIALKKERLEREAEKIRRE